MPRPSRSTQTSEKDVRRKPQSVQQAVAAPSSPIGLQRASTGTITPNDAITLQRTIGNQALTQMLHSQGHSSPNVIQPKAQEATSSNKVMRMPEAKSNLAAPLGSKAGIQRSGMGRTIQRGGTFESMNPEIDEREGKKKIEMPTVPSIASAATKTADQQMGGHAWVFLAKGATPETMEYFTISLNNNPFRIAINTLSPSIGWPSQEKSTTWQISNEQADNALAKANEFVSKVESDEAMHKKPEASEPANDSLGSRISETFGRAKAFTKRKLTREVKYSLTGMGWKRYNCAAFAEEILQAADVKRSAGMLVSTPWQVATGETNRGMIWEQAKRQLGIGGKKKR